MIKRYAALFGIIAIIATFYASYGLTDALQDGKDLAYSSGLGDISNPDVMRSFTDANEANVPGYDPANTGVDASLYDNPDTITDAATQEMATNDIGTFVTDGFNTKVPYPFNPGDAIFGNASSISSQIVTDYTDCAPTTVCETTTTTSTHYTDQFCTVDRLPVTQS